MIACQRFARLELDLQPTAVLAAVPIARKQEGVRDLTAEATWDVNKAHQPDHCRARQRQLLGTDYTIRIRLDDLRLSINHQPQGAA
jgi:hypothetical protein